MTAVGPLAGGWLVETLSWRSIFFLNLPLALVAVVIGNRCLQRAGARARASLDWVGAALCAVSLGGFVYALIEGPPQGWPRPAWLSGVLGAVALATFVVWERHAARPMLPLALFRRRQFSAANLTTLMMYFGLSGAMFLVVLGLQQGLGYGPLGSSLILLPLSAIMLVLSPLAGKLAHRSGYRVPMTIGPLCSGAGLAIAAQAGLFARNLPWLLAGMCVFAVGLSLTVAPLTSAVMSAADESDAGIASAVNNAVARVAGLLGIAILPAVGNVSTATSGAPFLGAIRGSLLATSAVCAAGGIVSWFGLPSRASRQTVVERSPSSTR
jgi:MFS family permease